MQFQMIRRITSAHASFSLHRHATRHLVAHSSRPWLRLLYPRLALLLSLMLFAGLSGCGPASSDNTPNLGPRASGAGLPPASSVSHVSENGTGSVSGRTTISGGDNSSQGDKQPLKSAGMPNDKADGRDQSPAPIISGIPDSVAKDLDSPDARVRFQALNHWTKPKSTASLEPLFVALEDEAEAVRAKATEIIERHWAIEQERERN